MCFIYRLITTAYNFLPSIAVETVCKLEKETVSENLEGRRREGEKMKEGGKYRLCVLVSPLPLVFTWLLIHYTEQST